MVKTFTVGTVPGFWMDFFFGQSKKETTTTAAFFIMSYDIILVAWEFYHSMASFCWLLVGVISFSMLSLRSIS